jgi:hypothetical protein
MLGSLDGKATIEPSGDAFCAKPPLMAVRTNAVTKNLLTMIVLREVTNYVRDPAFDKSIRSACELEPSVVRQDYKTLTWV